jgi:hypothetical protein
VTTVSKELSLEKLEQIARAASDRVHRDAAQADERVAIWEDGKVKLVRPMTSFKEVDPSKLGEFVDTVLGIDDETIKDGEPLGEASV